MGRIIKGINDKELNRLVKNLAKNVQRERAKQGLTMQSLATLAKMATSTVFEIENGKVEDFRMSTITALAQKLGVDPLELLK
ncbi:helix-turn-helix domain-containing protein [Bdellovibrio sp. HCB290]|uniref:helix-turn-helix domain-containing protein n=1 Tax=Bdellovibrio sp. HCB290 TaxID=3394356 RepID=UPI0039B379E3